MWLVRVGIYIHMIIITYLIVIQHQYDLQVSLKKMEGGSNAWIVIYICFVDITYYKQEYIRKSWGKYQSGMIILSTWEVKKCGVWVRFCIIFKPQNGCGWSGWDLVLQNGWDNRDIYIYIWLVSIIRNINWCSRLHK